MDESGKELSTEVEKSENESITIDETKEDTSEENYPGADVVEIVNLCGDENGVEWNEFVKTR